MVDQWQGTPDLWDQARTASSLPEERVRRSWRNLEKHFATRAQHALSSRAGPPLAHEKVAADRGPVSAEALRQFRGKWVAIKDGKVLMVAERSDEIVEKLLSSGGSADSLFRVPIDPTHELLTL